MFNSSYRTKFPNSSSEDDSDYGENRTMSQTPATATTTSPPPPQHTSSSSGLFHRPFASRVNITGDEDEDDNSDDNNDHSSPPPLKFPLDPPEDLMDLEPSEVNHKVSSQICTSSSITSERIFGADNQFMELNESYVVYNSRVLGRGSFGEVKLCYCRADKSFYALKILNKKQLEKLRMGLAGDNLIDKVLEEIEIMKKIRHENVIALKEVIDDTINGRIYLILELAEYGTLFAMNNGFVEEDEDGRVQIPENAVKELTVSLVEALSHAHEVAHVAHRDIKPENILLNNDNQVKLSDFGVGCFVSHHQQESLVREGSISFLPPEMLLPITDKMVVAALPSTPGFGLGQGAMSGTWGEASVMYSPVPDQLIQSAYGSQAQFMSVSSLPNLASNSTLAQKRVPMGSGYMTSGGVSPDSTAVGGGTSMNNNFDPPPFSLSSQQFSTHPSNNEPSHQDYPLDQQMINFRRKTGSGSVSPGGGGVNSMDDCTNTRSTNNDILSPIRPSPFHEHLAQPDHSLDHSRPHHTHTNDYGEEEEDVDLSKSNKSKSEGLSENMNEQMLNISFAGRMGAGPFQRDFSAAGTPRMRPNGDTLQHSSSTLRRRRPTKTLSSPRLTSMGSMRRRPLPLPTSPDGASGYGGTPVGGRSSSFILSNDGEDPTSGIHGARDASIGSGHIDLLAATDLRGGGSLGRRGGLDCLLGNVDDLCRSTNTNHDEEDVVGIVDRRGYDDDDNLYLNHLPKTPGTEALASVDRANSPAYDPESTSASPSPRRPGRERNNTIVNTKDDDDATTSAALTGDNNEYSSTLVPSGLPPRVPSHHFKSSNSIVARPMSIGSDSVQAFSSQDEDDETSSRRTSSLSERPGEDGAGGEAFSYLSNSQAPLSALKQSVSQQRMLSSSFCGSPLSRGGFAMSPLAYGLDASGNVGSSATRRFLPHHHQPDNSAERVSPQLHPTASSRGDSIFWEGLSAPAATTSDDQNQQQQNNTTAASLAGPVSSPTSNSNNTGTGLSCVSSPVQGGGAARGPSTQRPPLVPCSHTPPPLSKSPHNNDSSNTGAPRGANQYDCADASGSPGQAVLASFHKFESDGGASGNVAAASTDSVFASISHLSHHWSPAHHASNQHLQQLAPPLAAQSEHNNNMAAASTLGYANLGWRTINRNEVDLFKADVWALGVTVFVMLHGHLPWMAHAGLPPKTHRSSQDRARLLDRLRNMMVAKRAGDGDEEHNEEDKPAATAASSSSLPELSTLRIESIYKACAVPQWLRDSDDDGDNDDCGESKLTPRDFSGSMEARLLSGAIDDKNTNINNRKEQRADGLNSSSSSLLDGENPITTRLDPYSRYRLKKYRKWRDRKFRAERHNNRLRREINYIIASFDAFVEKHNQRGQVDRRGSRFCSRQLSKSGAHHMARSSSEFADNTATPLQNRSRYHSFVNSGPNSGTKYAASRSNPSTIVESPTEQNPPEAESTMRGENANQFISMSVKKQYQLHPNSSGSLRKSSMNSNNKQQQQQLHDRRFSGNNVFPPQTTAADGGDENNETPPLFTSDPPHSISHMASSIPTLTAPSDASLATVVANEADATTPINGRNGGSYDIHSIPSTPTEGTLLARRTPLAANLQLPTTDGGAGAASATSSSNAMFPTLEQAIIHEHLNSNINSPNSPYLVMKYQANIKGHYHSSNRTSPTISPSGCIKPPTATTACTTTVVNKGSPLGLAFAGVASFLTGNHLLHQQLQPSSSNNSNNASRKYLYSPNVQSVSKAESSKPQSSIHLPGMLLSSSQRDLVAAAVIHRQNRQWKLNWPQGSSSSVKGTPKHGDGNGGGDVTSSSFIRVTESESTEGGGCGSTSSHNSGYHHSRPTFVKIHESESPSSRGKDTGNAMFHTTHPRVLQIMRNEERDDRRNIERANWEYWTSLVKKSGLIIEDCPEEENQGSLMSSRGGGVSRRQSNSRRERERSVAHSSASFKAFKAGAPPPTKYSRLDCRAPEERQLLAILANPDPVRMLHSHMISEQPLHREDGEYTEEMAKMTLEHIEQLREIEFAAQATAVANTGLYRALSTSLSHNHLPTATTPAGDDEFENDFYVGGGGRHQRVETPAGCDSPAKNPSELGGAHNLPTVVKMPPNAFTMNSSDTSYVEVPTNVTGAACPSKDVSMLVGGMSPLDHPQSYPLIPSTQQLNAEGSNSSQRLQPTPTQTFTREASNLHLQRSMFSLANSFQVSPATLERNLSELGSAFGHRPPSTPGSTPAFHGVENSSIVGGLLLPQSSSACHFGSYGASGTDGNASFAENASFAYGSFSAVVNFLPKGRRNPSNSVASGSPSINPNNISMTSEQQHLLNSRGGLMMPPSRAPSAEEPTRTPLSPAPIRCDTDVISSNVASDVGGGDGIPTAASSPTLPPPVKIKATVIKRRDGLRTRRVCRREPSDMKKRLHEFQQRLRASAGPTTLNSQNSQAASINFILPQKRNHTSTKPMVTALDEKCLNRSNSSHHPSGTVTPSTQQQPDGDNGGSRTSLRRGDRSSSWDGMRTVESDEIPFLRNPPNHVRNDLPLGPSSNRSMMGRQRGYSETSQSDGGGIPPAYNSRSNSEVIPTFTSASTRTGQNNTPLGTTTGCLLHKDHDGVDGAGKGGAYSYYPTSWDNNTCRNTDATRRTGSSPGASTGSFAFAVGSGLGSGVSGGGAGGSGYKSRSSDLVVNQQTSSTHTARDTPPSIQVARRSTAGGGDNTSDTSSGQGALPAKHHHNTGVVDEGLVVFSSGNIRSAISRNHSSTMDSGLLVLKHVNSAHHMDPNNNVNQSTSSTQSPDRRSSILAAINHQYQHGNSGAFTAHSVGGEVIPVNSNSFGRVSSNNAIHFNMMRSIASVVSEDGDEHLRPNKNSNGNPSNHNGQESLGGGDFVSFAVLDGAALEDLNDIVFCSTSDSQHSFLSTVDSEPDFYMGDDDEDNNNNASIINGGGNSVNYYNAAFADIGLHTEGEIGDLFASCFRDSIHHLHPPLQRSQHLPQQHQSPESPPPAFTSASSRTASRRPTFVPGSYGSPTIARLSPMHSTSHYSNCGGGSRTPTGGVMSTNMFADTVGLEASPYSPTWARQASATFGSPLNQSSVHGKKGDLRKEHFDIAQFLLSRRSTSDEVKALQVKLKTTVAKAVAVVHQQMDVVVTSTAATSASDNIAASCLTRSHINPPVTTTSTVNNINDNNAAFGQHFASRTGSEANNNNGTPTAATTLPASNPLTTHQARILRRRLSSNNVGTPNATGLSNPVSSVPEEDELTGFVGLDRSPSGADADANSMVGCVGFSSGPLSNAHTTMTTTSTTASNTMAVTVASSCADSPKLSPKATVVQTLPVNTALLCNTALPQDLVPRMLASDSSSEENDDSCGALHPIASKGPALFYTSPLGAFPTATDSSNAMMGMLTRSALANSSMSGNWEQPTQQAIVEFVKRTLLHYIDLRGKYLTTDPDPWGDDDIDDDVHKCTTTRPTSNDPNAKTTTLLASIPQSVSTLFDVFCQTLVSKIAKKNIPTATTTSGLPVHVSTLVPSPNTSSAEGLFPVTTVTAFSSTRFDNNDDSSDTEIRRSPRQKSTVPSTSFQGSRRTSQEAGNSIDLFRGTVTPPCAEGGLVGSMATMGGGGDLSDPVARLRTLNSIQSFESLSTLPQSKSPYVRPDTELLGAKTYSDGLDSRAPATPLQTSHFNTAATESVGGGHKEIYDAFKAILDQETAAITLQNVDKSDAHIAGNSTIVAVIYSILIFDDVQLTLDDLNDPAEVSTLQKSMTVNDVPFTSDVDSSPATIPLGQLVCEVSTSTLNESAKDEVGKEWSNLSVEDLTFIILKSVGEVANAIMRRHAAATAVRPSTTLTPEAASRLASGTWTSDLGIVGDLATTTQQPQHKKSPHSGDSPLVATKQQLSDSSSHLHINSAANSRSGRALDQSAAAVSSPLYSGTGTSRKQSGSHETTTGSSITFGSNLNLFGAATMISGDFVIGNSGDGGSCPSRMLNSADAAQAYSPVSVALSMFPPSSNLAKRLADLQELFPSTTVTSTIESFRKRKERRRNLRKGLIKKQLKYVVGLSKRCGANYNRTVNMSKMGENYGVQAVARLFASESATAEIEVVDEKGLDGYVDQSEWNTKIEDEGEDDLAFFTTPAFNKCTISHFRECTAGCTSESISFIRAALRLDPATRPAMKDLLEHPWLTDLYRERCEERRLEAEKLQQQQAASTATPEQVLTPFRSVHAPSCEAPQTEEVASTTSSKNVNRVVFMGTLQQPDEEDDPLGSASLVDGGGDNLQALPILHKPSSNLDQNNNSGSGGVFGTSSNPVTNDCSVTFGAIDPSALAETAAKIDGKTISQVASSASQSFTAHHVPPTSTTIITAKARGTPLPTVPSTPDVIHVSTASPSPLRYDKEPIQKRPGGRKATDVAITTSSPPPSPAPPRRKSTTVAGGSQATTTSRRRGRITFAELIQRTQDNKTMRRTKLGMEGEGKNPLVGTHGFTKPPYRIDTTDVADSIITNRGGANCASINPRDVGSPLFASSFRMSKSRRQRSSNFGGGDDSTGDLQPSDPTLQSRLRRQRSQSKIVTGNMNNNASSMDTSGALDQSMSQHYSPDPPPAASTSKRSTRRQSAQQSPKLGTYTAIKGSSLGTKVSGVTATAAASLNSMKLEIPLPFSPMRSLNESVGTGGIQQTDKVQSPTFSQVREYGSQITPGDGSQRGSGYVRDLQSSFRFNRDDPRMANWSAIISSPHGTVHPVGSSQSSSVRVASLAESPTTAGPPGGLQCGSQPPHNNCTARMKRNTSSASLRHQRGSITRSLHSEENSPCNNVAHDGRTTSQLTSIAQSQTAGREKLPSPVFGMRGRHGSSSSYPAYVNVSTKLHLCDVGEDDSDESKAMPEPPNNSFQSNAGIIVSEDVNNNNPIMETSSETATTRQDSSVYMATTPPTPIVSTRGSNLGVDAPHVRRTVSFTTHTTADREPLSTVDRTSSSLRRGSNYGRGTSTSMNDAITNHYSISTMMMARPTLSLPDVNVALMQMYLLQQLEETVGNWTMDDEDGSVSRWDSALEMESTERHPADDSVDGSTVYGTRVESALGGSTHALINVGGTTSASFRTPQHSSRPSGIAFMSGSSDGGSNVKTPYQHQPNNSSLSSQQLHQHHAGTSVAHTPSVERESSTSGRIMGFIKRIINPKSSVSKSPSGTDSIPDNHSDVVNRNPSYTSAATNPTATVTLDNQQQSVIQGDDDGAVIITTSDNSNNNLPHSMRSLSGASAFMGARPVESDEGGMFTSDSATISSRFLAGADNAPTTTSATSPQHRNNTTTGCGSFPPLGPTRPLLAHISTTATTVSPCNGIFATAALSSGTSLATLMHNPPAAVATHGMTLTHNTTTTTLAATPTSATKGMTGLSKIFSVGDLLDEYDEENSNTSPTMLQHQIYQENSSPTNSGDEDKNEDSHHVEEGRVVSGGVGSPQVDELSKSDTTCTTQGTSTTESDEEDEDQIVTTVGQEIVYSALLNASDFGLLQPENPNGDNGHLFPLRPAQTFDPAIRRAYSLMNLRGLMLGSFSPEQLRWEPFEYYDLSSTDDEEDDIVTTTDHSPENTPGATRTSSAVNPNLGIAGKIGSAASIKRIVASKVSPPASENPPSIFTVPYAVDVDLNDPDAPQSLSSGRFISSRRLSINGNDLGAPMTLCNSFSYAQRTPTVSDNHAPSFPSRRNTLLTSGHALLTAVQHPHHAGGGARGGATLSTGTTSTLHSQLTSPTEMIPPTLMMNEQQQHPLPLSSHSPRTLNTTTSTATDNDESVSSPPRWIGPQHQTPTYNVVTTSTTTADDTTTTQSPNTPFGVANSFVSDVIPTRQRARSTISGNAPVYPALRISHSNQGLSGLTSPIAGSPRPSRGSHDGSPKSDHHHHQQQESSTTTTSIKMGHRTLTANEQLGSSSTYLGGSGMLIPTPMPVFGRTASGHGTSPARRPHQRSKHHKNSPHSHLFGGAPNSGLSRTPSAGTGTSSPNRNSFLVSRGAPFDSPVSSTLSPSNQDLMGGGLGVRTRRATTANHVEIFPESASTPPTVFSSPNRSRKGRAKNTTSVSSGEASSLPNSPKTTTTTTTQQIGRDIRKFSTLTSEPTSPAADHLLDGSGRLSESGGNFRMDAASPTNASIGREWRVFDDSPRETSPLRSPLSSHHHGGGEMDGRVLSTATDVMLPQTARTPLSAPPFNYNNTSSMDIHGDDDNDAWPNNPQLDHDTPSQVCTTASFSGEMKIGGCTASGAGGAATTTTDSDTGGSRKVTPSSEQMSRSTNISPSTRASPFSPSRRRRSSVHRLARLAIPSSGSTSIPIGTPESVGYAQTPGPRPLSLPGLIGVVPNSTIANNSFSRGSQSTETLPHQQQPQQQLASNNSWVGFEGPTLQITRSRRGSIVARSSSTINHPPVSNSSIPSIVQNNSSLGFSCSSSAAMNNNNTSPSVGIPMEEEEEYDTHMAEVVDAFQHNSSHPTTTAETSAAPSVGAVSASSTAMQSPQLPATTTPHREAAHVTMEDFEEEETVIQFCWRPEYGNRFVLNPMIFWSIGGRNSQRHNRGTAAASSSSPLGAAASPMFSLMSAMPNGGSKSSQDNLDSSLNADSTNIISSWRLRRVTATPGLSVPLTPPTFPDASPPATTTSPTSTSFIGTTSPAAVAVAASTTGPRPPARNRARSVVSFAGESILATTTTPDSSNSNSNAALPPPTFETVPSSPPLMCKRALSDTIKYVDGAHRTEVPRMSSVNSVDELLQLPPIASSLPSPIPPSSTMTNPSSSSTTTTAAVSLDNNAVSNILVSGSAMMTGSGAFDISRRTSGAGTTTTSMRESPLISHSSYALARHPSNVMMMQNHQLHHGGATTSHSGESEASSTPQPSWYRKEKEYVVSASASSSVSPCLVAYVPNSPILGITDSHHHHQDSNNNSQNPEHPHQHNPVSNSEEGSSSPHPPSVGGGTSGRGSVGSLPPTAHRGDDNRSPYKGAPNAPPRQQFARFPVGNSVLSMMSEDDYMYSAYASPRQQAASCYSPTSSIRGSLNLGQASPTMMGGGGYNSSQTASLQQSPLKGAAAGTSTTPLGGDEDDDDDVRDVQHVLGSGRTAQQQQGNQYYHSDNYNAVYLLGAQEMSECSLTGSSLTGSNTLARPTISNSPTISNENAAASDSGVVSAFGNSMASSLAAQSPNQAQGSSSMNTRPSPIAHATSPQSPRAAATTISNTTTLPMPSVSSPGTGAVYVANLHHRLGAHSVLPSQASMGTLYISPASTPASTPQTTPSQGPTSNTSPFVGPGAASGSGSLRLGYTTTGTTPPGFNNTNTGRGGGVLSPMSSPLHPLLPPSSASLLAHNRPRSPTTSLGSETNDSSPHQQQQMERNHTDEST